MCALVWVWAGRIPPCLQRLLASKPWEAWQKTLGAHPVPRLVLGGDKHGVRLGAGRSQLERPEGGPARAERHRLSQAPNARCRWQVGGAAATAAGETRVWRPFAASGSPFPPLSPSPDLEKAKGNSRCARTREQRSIPVPLHYFVFNEEGCAWGLGTGSERRRRGRLLLSR